MTLSQMPKTGRILSIDQFRGYTILGMIFVNYMAKFDTTPEFFKHHAGYMTYADTIAPIFLFVAGMGFRLSMLRKIQVEGFWKALRDGARRYVILTFIGILYYGPLDWHEWWDALVDIGFSGLLALPVIAYGAAPRIIAAVGYMFLYQLLFVYGGYGAWTMANSFDGGPLGPLSWAFCLILGTVAYDLIATRDNRRIVTGCLAWGIGLSIVGWGLRVEWPGVKEFWPFSQKAMSMPYPIFGTGLSFLFYLPFYFLADRWGIELPTLSVVGANPLVIYLLHGAYLDGHETIVAADSGMFKIMLAFVGLYLMCYAVAKYLYKNRYFVKI